MNKWSKSEDLVNELQTTQGYELLDNSADEDEFRKTLVYSSETKLTFLTALKEAGYSEFMQGIMLGIAIAESDKTKITKVAKRNWIPSIFKKD